MIKLSITIKGDNHKMTVTDIFYYSLEISKDSPTLQDLVQKAIDQFPLQEGEESPQITVKAVLDWQN